MLSTEARRLFVSLHAVICITSLENTPNSLISNELAMKHLTDKCDLP